MEYLAIDSRLIETVPTTAEDAEPELTIEDFLEFSTAELKFFLMNLGESVSGCRAELAERALLAQQRKKNAGPSEPKKFKIEQEQTTGEFNSILEEYGLTDPDVLNAWSVDISALPILDVGKIFHYILTKEAFDTYYLSDYKTKKAYQYLEAVCVRSIKVQCSADFIFVRGAVAQLNESGDGYEANKPTHISKLLMSSDGDIIVSCCSCSENLYQCCNHVIAVLFRVERLVREMDSRDGLSNLPEPTTDREGVKPVKITDLFKKKDLFAQSLLGKIPKPSAEEKRKFMEKICKTAPNSLFAQMFRGAIDAGQNLTTAQSQSEQSSTLSIRMKDGKQTIVVVGRGPDEKAAGQGAGGAHTSGVQTTAGLQASDIQVSGLPRAVAVQASPIKVVAGPPRAIGIQTTNLQTGPTQAVGVQMSGIQVAAGNTAGNQVVSGGQLAARLNPSGLAATGVQIAPSLQAVPSGLIVVGGQNIVGRQSVVGGQQAEQVTGGDAGPAPV